MCVCGQIYELVSKFLTLFYLFVHMFSSKYLFIFIYTCTYLIKYHADTVERRKLRTIRFHFNVSSIITPSWQYVTFTIHNFPLGRILPIKKKCKWMPLKDGKMERCILFFNITPTDSTTGDRKIFNLNKTMCGCFFARERTV